MSPPPHQLNVSSRGSETLSCSTRGCQHIQPYPAHTGATWTPSVKHNSLSQPTADRPATHGAQRGTRLGGQHSLAGLWTPLGFPSLPLAAGCPAPCSKPFICGLRNAVVTIETKRALEVQMTVNMNINSSIINSWGCLPDTLLLIKQSEGAQAKPETSQGRARVCWSTGPRGRRGWNKVRSVPAIHEGQRPQGQEQLLVPQVTASACHPLGGPWAPQAKPPSLEPAPVLAGMRGHSKTSRCGKKQRNAREKGRKEGIWG